MSKCSFPVFSFSFALPPFPGFDLPSLPDFSFPFSFPCPLD